MRDGIIGQHTVKNTSTVKSDITFEYPFYHVQYIIIKYIILCLKSSK